MTISPLEKNVFTPCEYILFCFILDGLTVPVDDMEEFCGQTPNLFVSIDQNNFVREIQEADNVALIQQVTLNGLNCDSNIMSQAQSCKFSKTARQGQRADVTKSPKQGCPWPHNKD